MTFQTIFNEEDNNNIKEGGKSQKDKLFNRGKAMSGAPISKGKKKFPKPPKSTGINMNNIPTSYMTTGIS